MLPVVTGVLFLGRSNPIAMKTGLGAFFWPFDGLPTFLHPFGGKRAYGAFWGLSWGPFRLSTESLLGLSGVRGNSRAPVFSVIRGSQTRSCRAFAGAVRVGDAFYSGGGKGTERTG